MFRRIAAIACTILSLVMLTAWVVSLARGPQRYYWYKHACVTAAGWAVDGVVVFTLGYEAEEHWRYADGWGSARAPHDSAQMAGPWYAVLVPSFGRSGGLLIIGCSARLWFLTAAFGAYPLYILLVRGALVTRWRRRHHLCVKCAYNLTGNESGVCPECGTPVMPARAKRQV